MEIKQAARRYEGYNIERIYVRHEGEAANINVYRRNAKPYDAMSEDWPRKRSNHDPHNSSVYAQRKGEVENVTVYHRNVNPYDAISEDRLRKSTELDPKNSSVSTVYHKYVKPYDAISKDRLRKTTKLDPKNSSVSTAKAQQQEDKICKYWKSGHCARGDKCWYLHSWWCGDGFTMLAKLEGHKKAVRGIGLPLGSEKLYSGSSDGTLRTWDCHSGKCAGLSNLGDEVCSLIAEGPWVFILIPLKLKVLLSR